LDGFRRSNFVSVQIRRDFWWTDPANATLAKSTSKLITPMAAIFDELSKLKKEYFRLAQLLLARLTSASLIEAATVPRWRATASNVSWLRLQPERG
jgi:hypothetical protein